jgi:hypothetical protein
MAYGSISDIYLLGYIPKEDIDALEADEPGCVAAAFDAESGKFDAYLRPRYGVPWPDGTAPPELVDAVTALVVFRFYIRRGFSSVPEGSDVAKEIIASRDEAKKFRDDIRAGTAQLNWRVDATPSSLESGPSTGLAAMPSQMKSGSYSATITGRIPRGGCGC